MWLITIIMVLASALNSYAESSFQGTYKWNNKNGEGIVEIRHESSNSLEFVIGSEWGGRTCGDIIGRAVLTKSIATFDGKNEYDGCLIAFNFKNNKLIVETSESCDKFCGETAKGSMAGIYKKMSSETKSISDSELCGDDLLKRFSKRIKKLASKDYQKLIKNIQVSGCAKRDGNEVIITGCAPHLCTSEEGIIAINTLSNTISIGIVSNNNFRYYSENKNFQSEAIQKFKSKWD